MPYAITLRFSEGRAYAGRGHPSRGAVDEPVTFDFGFLNNEEQVTFFAKRDVVYLFISVTTSVGVL